MSTDRFKFRVWDNNENKYLDYCNLTECGNAFMIDCFEKIHYCNDCIIEQCTGLRDKLGKLIYEGDIVNLSPSDSEEYKSRLVYWCRDHWGTKELSSPDVWSFSPMDEMEIVGNIHERS